MATWPMIMTINNPSIVIPDQGQKPAEPESREAEASQTAVKHETIK